MFMKQRPIIFDTVFEVEECKELIVIDTMVGKTVVGVGDYLFTHPDGTKSKVKKESISQFEEVESIKG